MRPFADMVTAHNSESGRLANLKNALKQMSTADADPGEGGDAPNPAPPLRFGCQVGLIDARGMTPGVWSGGLMVLGAFYENTPAPRLSVSCARNQSGWSFSSLQNSIT